MKSNSLSGAAVAAFVLLAGGGLLLLGNLGFLGESFTTGGFLRKYWPIILISVGLWRFAADGYRLGLEVRPAAGGGGGDAVLQPGLDTAESPLHASAGPHRSGRAGAVHHPEGVPPKLTYVWEGPQL